MSDMSVSGLTWQTYPATRKGKERAGGLPHSKNRMETWGCANEQFIKQLGENDALPSPDMTNANVQRGECSFSEHRSASPTRGEVCSLFSFVHNEFASASLPHHTYHIHNSVPSVFDSSPFEVTVGTAYHEAWGTHTHKHGTRSLFVTKVYALHTVYMHFSGRRPLPCHNISRDMDRTEDPSHQSPTKGTNASLIAGEVCSPPNPIQRSSARAQDTNLLTSLGVDSWTSVFVHSSVIHPSPYHPVPSDEEQGGMPSHTHTENDQNTSLAAREVCFSPDHTRQRRGRHVTFWFYSLYCLPVSLHCESPIAQECQGVSTACCGLTLVHRDKPHTGQPPFDGTNTSHASRIWSIINLLGGGVRLSVSARLHSPADTFSGTHTWPTPSGSGIQSIPGAGTLQVYDSSNCFALRRRGLLNVC